MQALGFGSGQPIAPTQRLTTMQMAAARPGTGAGLPPPMTAAGRPMSALKRLPTAGGAALQNVPVGLATELKVAARPMTQQGVGGVQTKSLGPGRQLADKSYYVAEIRNKLQDITREIETMRTEMEKCESDSVRYGKLERRYEVVVKDVRDLEGQLADFNLALDKLRNNTKVHDIQAMHQRLLEKNASQRALVDELFVKRTADEAATAQLEAQLGEVHARATDKLAALGHQAQEEYSALGQRSQQLQQALAEREARSQELEQRIKMVRHELKSDAHREQANAVELSKKKEQLIITKQELTVETTESMNPEQIREKLLHKVKQDSNAIRLMEEQVKNVEERLDALQEEIRTTDHDLNEAKKHSQKSKKYEALYERDRKMQDFIDRYAETKQQELDQLAKLQQTIVALMEHISKNINRQKNLPDQKQLGELKDELSFKTQTLTSSKTTLDHLQKELEKRRAELDKIDTLDEKINKELTVLTEKMAAMQREMKTFKLPEQLQEEAQANKKDLMQRKQVLKTKRDAIRQTVQQLSQSLEKQKKELEENETMKRLEAMQQKLRAYSQNVFSLSDYIATRKREGDYDTLLRDVTALTDQINNMHVQQAAKP